MSVPAPRDNSSRCCRRVCSELHFSRLWLQHNDREDFVHSPWLPRQLKWQWLYVVYRWTMAIYFFAWFMVMLNNASTSIKAKYLIYLTNWAYIIWNTYLIYSAVTVTLKQLNSAHENNSQKTLKSGQTFSEKEVIIHTTEPEKSHTLQLTWHDKLQWVLFSIGTEGAVAVTILYWSLFYNPHTEHNLFSIDSLHMHLINGIVALFELWITAIPVRLYHAVHFILFALIYVIFTLFYYIANGTDPNGNHFIYPFLNYKLNPSGAFGLALGCVFIFTTLIHVTFFLVYLCRCSIIYLFQRGCCRVRGQRSRWRRQRLSEHSFVYDSDTDQCCVD